MDIWKTLGIQPTDNVRAIKRAYGKQLALHHPEDDPEGFRCVQEAFDAAMGHARRTRERSDAAPSAPGPCDDAEASDSLRLNASIDEGPSGMEGRLLSDMAVHHVGLGDARPPMDDGLPAGADLGAAEQMEADFRFSVDAKAGAHPGCAQGDDAGVVDWPARFLAYGRGGGVFAGKDSAYAHEGSPEYMRRRLADRECLRARAAEWISGLADATRWGDSVAIESYFRANSWTAYTDLEGFDEVVGEMLLPVLESLPIKAVSAIGVAADPPQDAIHIRAAFEHAEATFCHKERSKISPTMRRVLFCLAIALIVGRMFARANADVEAMNEVKQLPAMEQVDEAGHEPSAEEKAEAEYWKSVQAELDLLEVHADQNHAFVLGRMEELHGEPFLMGEQGIYPDLSEEGRATCTVTGEKTGTVYNLRLAYSAHYLVTEILEETSA